MSIWTPERQAAARREAEEWRGTPHFDRMKSKGVGVDCINFVAAVVQASGIWPTFTMPGYSTRTGLGRSENVIERILLKLCHCEPVGETEEWQFGDIVIFTVGRQSNHVGIFLDGFIWHSMARHLVEPMPVHRSTFEAVQGVLRLTGDGFREGQGPQNITPEDFKA